ncbi:MAG: hypothetical protein ACRCZF_13630 [Gemmataceae bacterium]
MRPTPRNLNPHWRRQLALGWGFAIFLGFSGVGCRSNSKYDTIEAELRTRERELAETRAELENARNLNNAYGRGMATPPGLTLSGSATGAPALPISTVTLGPGTGGFDRDGNGSDELLQVVIVPKDLDGSAIKIPAKVAVTTHEFGTDGVKRLIGSWDVTPEQLRATWRSGLLTTGYFIALQWDQPPSTSRLRVSVRFVTLDGKPYEADKDVSARAGAPAATITPSPAATTFPSPNPLPPPTTGLVIPSNSAFDELPLPQPTTPLPAPSTNDRPAVRFVPPEPIGGKK